MGWLPYWKKQEILKGDDEMKEIIRYINWATGKPIEVFRMVIGKGLPHEELENYMNLTYNDLITEYGENIVPYQGRGTII